MTRRNLVKKGLLWLLGAGLSWPFFSFILKKRYRPPREIRISRKLEPGQVMVESEFVLFQTHQGPLAVSRTCTHLGCRINYLEEEKLFLCPCHQSRFDSRGKYLSGPARKDLSIFKVLPFEDGQGVTVYLPA